MFLFDSEPIEGYDIVKQCVINRRGGYKSTAQLLYSIALAPKGIGVICPTQSSIYREVIGVLKESHWP